MGSYNNLAHHDKSLIFLNYSTLTDEFWGEMQLTFHFNKFAKLVLVHGSAVVLVKVLESHRNLVGARAEGKCFYRFF